MISVIVPIYNVEKYLHRCVDSILAQTFSDFELILVDDGSPDNCGKICDEYAEKDSRIHVIHKENGGLSSARNAGIDWTFENSDSKWITFIDSDDWVHPKYLEFLYDAATKTGLGVSICDFERTTGEATKIFDSYEKNMVIGTEEFFCKKNVNAVIACAKLFKKEDFIDIRFPLGKLHEDEFTTYKILFKYDKIAFVDAPLYFYYVNQSSIMKSNWSPKRLAAFEAYNLQMNYFLENKYYEAYYFKEIQYANLLWHHIQLCQDTEYKETYEKVLKNKLRYYLKKHRKNLFNTQNLWFYEKFFPKRMKYYWYWQALKNKIKRKRA